MQFHSMYEIEIILPKNHIMNPQNFNFNDYFKLMGSVKAQTGWGIILSIL
jgi:hypothetical protein